MAMLEMVLNTWRFPPVLPHLLLFPARPLSFLLVNASVILLEEVGDETRTKPFCCLSFFLFLVLIQ